MILVLKRFINHLMGANESKEASLEAKEQDMRFVKTRGAIRHSDIQNELEKIGLKDAWVHFLLGQTMCRLDDNIDIAKLDNQGVYPVDLERFCYTNEIRCEITE